MPNTFDNYEILSKLGQGGMGAVFKARHIPSGRIVALKIMNPGRIPDETRERFFLEGRATARLRHRNIVAMHEINEWRGQLFLAMEFVEGKSLAEIIDEGMPDQQSAATWMGKVAWAVHHAHTQGLIHRDLKPANIMIDAGGEPIVMDFGIAKDSESLSALTATGVVIGTPAYMSPEQAQGRPLDGRSDVFSLGAILYTLVTRRPPFSGPSSVATMLAVVEKAPEAPSRLNPSCAPELERICLKALSKDPEDRYDTPGHMAEALQEFLDRLETRKAPHGTVTPPWRKSRVMVGVAVCSVAALLLTWAGYRIIIRGRPASPVASAQHSPAPSDSTSTRTAPPPTLPSPAPPSPPSPSAPPTGPPSPSPQDATSIAQADRLLPAGKFEEAADMYRTHDADKTRQDLARRLVDFRAALANAVGSGRWTPVVLKSAGRMTVRSMSKDSAVLMGPDGVMKAYSWDRLPAQDIYAIHKNCAGSRSAADHLSLGSLCLALGLDREGQSEFDEAVRLDQTLKVQADELRAFKLQP